MTRSDYWGKYRLHQATDFFLSVKIIAGNFIRNEFDVEMLRLQFMA